MKTTYTIREKTGVALAAIALTLAGCSKGDHDATTHEGHGDADAMHADGDKTAAPAPTAGDVIPYPLDVCSVSDEKLGSMGKPYVITYEGREIKFCCGGCEEDFGEDAATFLAKIDKAAAARAEKKPGS